MCVTSNYVSNMLLCQPSVISEGFGDESGGILQSQVLATVVGAELCHQSLVAFVISACQPSNKLLLRMVNQHFIFSP